MISKDINEVEVKNFKALLDYFKQLSGDGVNTLIEKQLLLMLDFSIPFFSNLVLSDVFEEINRITINKNVVGANKRIHDIDFLKYPPANKVSKYGRCNLPGQSVFYSSFFSITALNEMKPKIGDLITQTTWRVKGNQSLIYCPIFKNQPIDKEVLNPRTFEINKLYENKIKIYPNSVRQQIDALVQFVTDAFTKRVNPNNHLDYIFSSYFSNKIFNEFENGTIEAIYYPSVQEKLSFENVAIKADVFDKKYELVKVHDSVIVSDPSNGRGGYFMEGLSSCKSFDFASRKVLWDKDPNKMYQSPDRIKQLKNIYGVNLE